MVQLDITKIESDVVIDPSVIGTIFGDTGTDSFRFSMIKHAERSDLISVEHPDCGPVLCRIDSIIRKTNYTLDKSLSRDPDDTINETVVATAVTVGYRDSDGVMRAPRTPFSAGTDVKIADEAFIRKILGLKDDNHRSAYLGILRNSNIKIMLDLNSMVQRHACILARTGGGKTYVASNIVEDLMKHDVTCMIIDPRGEYGVMRNPSDSPDSRFGTEPRSFADRITEFGMNESLDVRPLRFTLRSLDAKDLMELCASSDSKGSVLALARAIETLKTQKGFYSISDLIEELSSADSSKHYALIRDLKGLEDMHLFAQKGNGIDELVQKGKTTIINLKGYPPDIQQIIVRRLGTILFEMRKVERIPPMMLMLEDAHIYCPAGLPAVSKKAISTISSEGRKFGLGLTVISQRPAKVDDTVLSQCGTQIMMKVTNPNDLQAIVSSVEGLTAGMEQEITTLPTGTAIIAGAGILTPLIVDIRTSESMHGSAEIEDDPDE